MTAGDSRVLLSNPRNFQMPEIDMQEGTTNPRLGFHYFPDTTHYREEDLDRWLPRLKRMGAHWITLISSHQRAIPEAFLRGLLDQHINPVIQVQVRCDQPIDLHSIHLLIDAYAKWGVQYLVLFDRPNTRQAWNANSWTRTNLVERFLDTYLPLAQATNQSGLIPVFPPLEPGGDYWDTVFLNSALHGMLRRGFEKLCSRLALGAYAWKQNHPIHWGAGGPEQWPASQPYFTPDGSEDQLGFHLFDWYQAQAVSVLHHHLPVILLGAGCRMQDCVTADAPPGDPFLHSQSNLEILHQLPLGTSYPTGTHPLPSDVIACNFWLLSSVPNHPYSFDAWFPQDQPPLPVVDAFNEFSSPSPTGFSRHYVLLPQVSWNEQDFIFQSVLPLMTRPDLIFGCSVEQALHACRVTIIGNEKWIDENQFQQLSQAECMIEEFYGDGTLLASKLSNL